jgi:tetratricopeptide (TPR) repeat protein
MNLEELIKQAKEYDDLDMPFSSAIFWQKAVEQKTSAYNMTQYANQLRLCGKFTQAEALFNEVDVTTIPDHYKCIFYDNKGANYSDQRKTDQAIEAYKQSIASGQDQTHTYIFLGTLLFRQEKLDEAEQVLLEALTKEGDVDEAYYNLSLVYARKGNFQEAIRTVKECLKLDPHFNGADTVLVDYQTIERLNQNPSF